MSLKTNIIRAYNEGKPLTSAEQHFLWMHYRELGGYMEKVAKYYRLTDLQARAKLASFLRPQGVLNLHRLKTMLADSPKGIELTLTPTEFLTLKNNINELLYFHGNQVLTGAPFFAGGVPHIDFFQWGNLMGVVKNEELPGEKIITGNILIYFEDMKDRNLMQCIQDYQRRQHTAPQPMARPPEQEITHTAPRPSLLLHPSVPSLNW